MTNIIIIVLAVGAACVSAFMGGIYFVAKRHKLKMVTMPKEVCSNTDYIYQSLNRYFQKEKPYLNPNLEVNEAARCVLTNRTYLAQAIKQHGMVNFNYFVNTYRVNEAIAIFKKDESARIGETAMMCGFNSTSAFGIAFKTVMGVTPRQWRLEYYGSLQASRSSQQTKRLKQGMQRTLRRIKDCRR